MLFIFRTSNPFEKKVEFFFNVHGWSAKFSNLKKQITRNYGRLNKLLNSNNRNVLAPKLWPLVVLVTIRNTELAGVDDHRVSCFFLPICFLEMWIYGMQAVCGRIYRPKDYAFLSRPYGVYKAYPDGQRELFPWRPRSCNDYIVLIREQLVIRDKCSRILLGFYHICTLFHWYSISPYNVRFPTSAKWTVLNLNVKQLTLIVFTQANSRPSISFYNLVFLLFIGSKPMGIFKP